MSLYGYVMINGFVSAGTTEARGFEFEGSHRCPAQRWPCGAPESHAGILSEYRITHSGRSMEMGGTASRKVKACAAASTSENGRSEPWCRELIMRCRNDPGATLRVFFPYWAAPAGWSYLI